MASHSICFMQNNRSSVRNVIKTQFYLELLSLQNITHPWRSIDLLNFLITKKQMTKFSSANFQKMLSPSYIILKNQRLDSKQCESR